MKKFTNDIFRSILNALDEQNDLDFESFINAFEDKYDELYDYQINEVIDYLVDQMGIENDMDVSNMSIVESKELIHFVNSLQEESYY